jgi:energy-coupling factor transport system substrate-specific component
MRRLDNVLGGLLLLLATVTGLVALLLPFIVPLAQTSADAVPALQSAQTPLLMVVLVTLCLAILLVEFQGSRTNAKIIAALGVMVAATAALRFIEVGIPGPGGFSPVFLPIIIGGYVFGPRFGFLLGTMGILVSALITGGVGPWLPYQALAAGWVGLGAGWLPQTKRPLGQLVILCAYGFLWGFLFGAIMNLTTWPLLVGDPAQTWSQGSGIAGALRSYGVFYAATSLVWDAVRALGNVALLLALGLPLVKALGRFRDRLQFEAVVI